MALFYRRADPNVKSTTINWRIYELVQSGVLERISRGLFRIGETRTYIPSPSKPLIRLFRDITAQFPYAKICIWETGWINEFAQHISNKSIIILETEKDVSEPVFYKLQESSKAVFLEPSMEIMERYVTTNKSPLVVKPMVSEAPLQQIGGISVPSLEKLLVDLYCDKEILYAFQGRELHHIWENAFSRYSIQQDKLLRYADRRRRKQEIMELLKKFYNPAAI